MGGTAQNTGLDGEGWERKGEGEQGLPPPKKKSIPRATIPVCTLPKSWSPTALARSFPMSFNFSLFAF